MVILMVIYLWWKGMSFILLQNKNPCGLFVVKTMQKINIDFAFYCTYNSFSQIIHRGLVFVKKMNYYVLVINAN